MNSLWKIMENTRKIVLLMVLSDMLWVKIRIGAQDSRASLDKIIARMKVTMLPGNIE